MFQNRKKLHFQAVSYAIAQVLDALCLVNQVVRHTPPILKSTALVTEEHSMDRCRCRPELSERLGAIGLYEFQGNLYGPLPWCLVSGEICMGQWPWKFVKCFPWDWYWSMDGSSQLVCMKNMLKILVTSIKKTSGITMSLSAISNEFPDNSSR